MNFSCKNAKSMQQRQGMNFRWQQHIIVTSIDNFSKHVCACVPLVILRNAKTSKSQELIQTMLALVKEKQLKVNHKLTKYTVNI